MIQCVVLSISSDVITFHHVVEKVDVETGENGGGGREKSAGAGRKDEKKVGTERNTGNGKDGCATTGHPTDVEKKNRIMQS